MKSSICAVEWRDNALRLLDQRYLPARTVYIDCEDSAAVATAIRDMVVRGAPAIGIAAAYGVVLAAQRRCQADADTWKQAIVADIDQLRDARPTAVNLHWALTRMQGCIAALNENPIPALLSEAQAIHAEDVRGNKSMGQAGAECLPADAVVLTHCNTGALATGGYGTALGVVRTAHQAGKIKQVYAGETRPWLQGSRLTAWELQQDKIPVTVLCDGAVASLLQSGQVDWVIVGADRIAANGDVANKIGTYSLAVLARHHGVKFMVVAPMSTLDADIASGDDIPVEHRGSDELLQIAGQQVGVEEVSTWNPVFDITPASLIDVIVTEKGVIHCPDSSKIGKLLSGKY